MKIILNEEELTAAVTDWVRSMGISSDTTIEVAFSGSRSNSGFSAEVDIQPIAKETAVPTAPAAPAEAKQAEPVATVEASADSAPTEEAASNDGESDETSSAQEDVAKPLFG